MTRLFVCDTTGITGEQYEALYALASPERKKRAAAYPKRKDAVCCLVAEALLRYAFPGREIATLLKEPGGKPYWEGAHFNLSHSGSLVVLAVGDSPVGVDVECFREARKMETLAKRYFTPEEQAFVADSQERFLQVWTAKEACLKQAGFGLRIPLDSFSVLEDPRCKTWLLPNGVLTLCASEHPNTWKLVEICKIAPYR